MICTLKRKLSLVENGGENGVSQHQGIVLDLIKKGKSK